LDCSKLQLLIDLNIVWLYLNIRFYSCHILRWTKLTVFVSTVLLITLCNLDPTKLKFVWFRVRSSAQVRFLAKVIDPEMKWVRVQIRNICFQIRYYSFGWSLDSGFLNYFLHISWCDYHRILYCKVMMYCIVPVQVYMNFLP
jgi:hypothetical protein